MCVRFAEVVGLLVGLDLKGDGMVAKGKTEKMSVTLPRELAAEVRSVVPQGDVSSFIAEAVEYYLALRRQKIALEKGFGAWKDENHPDLQTPDDSAEYVRRIREADHDRLTRVRSLAK